ncbi:hypothetical protein [Paenibacillus sp. YYML68]|uniref:hypothetical protein n=1 Tax=Paenibacillus sp. YYML68 TaxID=2909250 RepID=UPI002493A1FB|nr:hypothetical protein [Paenibacillus sp. YYML68]
MKEVNKEKYNQFIELIELQDISVEKVFCNKNKDFKQDSVSLDVAMDYTVEKAQQMGLEILIPFIFKVKAYNKDESIENDNIDSIPLVNTLFSIEIELLLTYFINTDEINIKEQVVHDFSDVLELFAERNVTINAWPYIREIVHNLTTKMRLPTLVIPLKKTI